MLFLRKIQFQKPTDKLDNIRRNRNKCLQHVNDKILLSKISKTDV